MYVECMYILYVLLLFILILTYFSEWTRTKHERSCWGVQERHRIDAAISDCYGSERLLGWRTNANFLVINFRTIQLPTRLISQAVHYLFASFYTFNIDYPKGLKQVFMFIEKLYGVRSSGPAGRAADLYDRLVAYWKNNHIDA